MWCVWCTGAKSRVIQSTCRTFSNSSAIIQKICCYFKSFFYGTYVRTLFCTVQSCLWFHLLDLDYTTRIPSFLSSLPFFSIKLMTLTRMPPLFVYFNFYWNTHPPSISLTHSSSPSLPLPPSHLSISFSHTHTHTRTHTLSQYHSLSHAYTHTHTFSPTPSLSHTHSHTLAHTHTHTHLQRAFETLMLRIAPSTRLVAVLQSQAAAVLDNFQVKTEDLLRG